MLFDRDRRLLFEHPEAVGKAFSKEYAERELYPRAFRHTEGKSNAKKRGSLPKGIAVLAVLFGGIHGGVGALKEVDDGAPVVGVDGNADAAREREVLAGADIGLVQSADHFAGFSGEDVRLVHIFEEHKELVSANARQRVRGTEDGADAVRHLAQHRVAEDMPEVVVDRLEIVEINHEQRMPPLVP